MRKQASILVGVLWCLALLSVVSIGALHTSRLDLRVVKNYGDQVQAHYLALAGLEKAKALLYHDAWERRRLRKNHTGQLYDNPGQFRDVVLGRGQFRVFRQGRPDERGGVLYGISDEESRLNINAASLEELAKLPGLNSEMAAAMVDWRDGDNLLSPAGAESEHYLALQPPRLPRNGPFQTTREVLMVRGISPLSFFGEDSNQNELLDLEEDDGNVSHPPDNQDGHLDPGWFGLITVNSRGREVNAAGEARVNIQSADENTLASVQGISSELAKAIVAYRGRNQLNSLADLLEVEAVRTEGQNRPSPNPSNQQGGPGPQLPPPSSAPPSNGTSSPVPTASRAGPTGQKLFSEDLLLSTADDLTAQSQVQSSGLININTAGPEVLACLPGVDPQVAQAIISFRQSNGYFPNIAWLLKAPGINRQLFQQIAPRVTVRSETFRILSEGKVTSTGARKRLQVIVQIGAYEVETLAYREDL